MDERVVAPRFLRRQVFADVEAFHFGGDARWKCRRVEPRNRGYTGARVLDRVPRRGDADTHRRDNAQSCDDDTATSHDGESVGSVPYNGRAGRESKILGSPVT